MEEPEKKETESPKCCNCKCQNQTVNLETKETETTEIGAQEIAKTEEKEDAKTEEKEDAKTEEKEETSAGKEKKYILPYTLYNLGPTVLRILGYMPNGEGDEDFFVKPSRDELTYDNRSKEEDLHIFMSNDHQTKIEELQEITKENNFYADGVKYVRLYDITEDYLGVMPIPPRGSDFFNEDFETIKDLHCEPPLNGRVPKHLRHKTSSFKAGKEGEEHDYQETIALITSELIMNTIGIHFGYLPKDLDPETFTKEDLTFYFYDRTGLNLSLFDLFKLRQYKRDIKVYGGLVGNQLDVLSSKEAIANTQANMLQPWQYFKNGKHLYHTTPLYEKEFKEMPDNPGKEILQVEGVMESCDKDLQEILKRDTEIEQDRLKGCLDLIKKDHPDVDIENFKDWEEIGYYKQTVPVRLCSLELQDDPEENSLILSKEDAEKSHFGTILPFVSDYTEVGTEDDPIEDAQSDWSPVTLCNQPTTDSLICKTEVDAPFFPTTLKRRHRKKKKEESKEDEKKEDNTFLGLEWEELYDYLKNNYRIPSMVSGFLFIASTMSLFLNTHMSITMTLFTLFNLTLGLEDRNVKGCRNADMIKENLKTDEDTNSKPPQKRITIRKSLPIRMAPYTRLEERQPYSQSQGRYVNSYHPRQGERKRRPRPNKNQILYTEEARDVQTSGDRPFLYVTVPGGYRLKSLYDTGASCCCISPTLLKHISSEKGVVCKNASFNICGVVAGDPDRCLQLAFVDLRFDNELLLKEVPFLVYECGYDIIFGNNVGKRYKWSMFWKNEDLFINTGICQYPPLKLFRYHNVKQEFPEPCTTDSGIMEGMKIEKELTPEEKKIQKEVQSLKINLDITRSNAKEINKILDDLELAYKTNKDAFLDFGPC